MLLMITMELCMRLEHGSKGENCMDEDERKKLIAVNLSHVTTAKDLHNEIKMSLNFPTFYGMNWDAFWDVITGMVELPEKLELIGWDNIENKLPQDAEILKCLLTKFNAEFPKWSCEILFI